MTGRRIRLTEHTPKPYVANLPERDGYTPPPPNPADDGPREIYARPPERGLGMLTMGEAFFVHAASHEDAVSAWRDLFPESAAVHDGVHVTEAGVDVQWITDDTKGEDDDR